MAYSGPKACIFCGAPGPLTAEHVFGDWILRGGFVPRSPHNKHDVRIRFLAPTGKANKTKVITKAGDRLGLNIKIVCGQCNSGWMSKIQEAAKNCLRHLFSGQPWVIGHSPQEAIATWASMATMTLEFISGDPTDISVPQTDRDYLRINGKPPPGWRVWMGTYIRTTWEGEWIRNAAPILEASEAAERDTALPNTQNTTFIVGNLCFHVMSGRFHQDFANWDWQTSPKIRGRLAPIWPVRQGLVRWPRQALNDRDVQDVAMAFFDIFHNLRKARSK